MASPRPGQVKWRCICCKHPADPASDRRAGLSHQFGYAPILVLPQRRNPAMKARTERRVALVAAMKQIERHFKLTHFDDHMPHPDTEKIQEAARAFGIDDRRSEEHTYELQSIMSNSYDVFRLQDKKIEHRHRQK